MSFFPPNIVASILDHLFCHTKCNTIICNTYKCHIKYKSCNNLGHDLIPFVYQKTNEMVIYHKMKHFHP